MIVEAALALVGRGCGVVNIGHILSRGRRIGFRLHASGVVISPVGHNTPTIRLLCHKPLRSRVNTVVPASGDDSWITSPKPLLT